MSDRKIKLSIMNKSIRLKMIALSFSICYTALGTIILYHGVFNNRIDSVIGAFVYDIMFNPIVLPSYYIGFGFGFGGGELWAYLGQILTIITCYWIFYGILKLFEKLINKFNIWRKR